MKLRCFINVTASSASGFLESVFKFIHLSANIPLGIREHPPEVTLLHSLDEAQPK